MELVRTNEVMTAGITNIPLTYPAKIFFNTKNIHIYNEQVELLHRYSLPYHGRFVKSTGSYFLQTDNLIPSSQMKEIWRNYKTLHPKFNSEYRYLFWELDSRDTDLMQRVMNVYEYLALPVYIKKSMNGYHFFSVKPISKDIFFWATDALRSTNPNYPPITLRIKPNKWIGEEQEFFEGFIVSHKYHADTQQLQRLIVAQDLITIGEKYQLVWYSLDKKKTTKESIIP